MQTQEKEWLEQQETRLEALSKELKAVLQTTRKWDPAGKLQALEVRLVVAPPWRNRF